jgi:acyl CoA:acetate/3-ketoacid CoA transferase beta subunit
MMSAAEFTLEELIIARMAKEFKGEAIATGATFLGEMAARLAKALYQPDLLLVGGGSHAAFDCDVEGRYFSAEWNTTPTARMVVGWEELFDMIAHGKLQIIVGPVQIDRRGNANISAVGSWLKPKVQFIGARGLPDDLWGNEKFFYHVRRHSKHAFVEQVDIVCALGFGKERERLGLKLGLPGTVISDLGVFGWNSADGHMCIESLHPDVTFEQVQAKTGFEWPSAYGRSFPVTTPPTAVELDLIRNTIDPLGWRRLESNEGSAALQLALCAQEAELVAARLGRPSGRSA